MQEEAYKVQKDNSYHCFGRVFLGPMLSEFARNVVSSTDKNVYCLAREGYFFKKIFDCLLQEQLISSNFNADYLICSRAALFKFSLGDERSWQYSLAPKFKGSLQALLNHRFGLKNYEFEDLFESKVLKQAVELPRDKDKVSELFYEKLEALSLIVEPSRRAYLSYLQQIGFTQKGGVKTVLDVGYSGTIQKLLTLLAKTDTIGRYFIASSPGKHQVADFSAQMVGVFNEGSKMGDGYPLLDRSIFIECLLTAPDGQFIDIRHTGLGTGEALEFFYGRNSNAQKEFYILEQVMAGAIKHVLFCFKNDIHYSTEDIESLYQQFVTRPNMLPSGVRHLFEIDDAISGNGNVSVQQLFRL